MPDVRLVYYLSPKKEHYSRHNNNENKKIATMEQRTRTNKNFGERERKIARRKIRGGAKPHFL
jgi:hypothetical protein